MTPEERVINNYLNTKGESIESVRNVMDYVHEELTKKDNPKLPEPLFVELFLPYFTGQKPLQPDDAVFNEWVSIAGTVINEVDVIDQAGEVLYTVPSLIDTTMINPVRPERSSELSFMDIGNGYAMRQTNSPAIADKFLGQELPKKVAIVEPSSELSRVNNNVHKWQHILNRYGLNKSQSTIDPNLAIKQALDDDISYE